MTAAPPIVANRSGCRVRTLHMPLSAVTPIRGGDLRDDSTSPVVAMTVPPPPDPPRPGLEPEIAEAFCRGDTDALGAVFDVFSGAVWSVAMSVLRDRQLAEDATQEAFMRAWRSADRFDPTRPMGPWLLTIARRTALDVYRREFRPTRGGHVEEQDVGFDVPGIERAWEVWEVKLALDRLPEAERVVVRLAHFAGMTHPQIASELELPVGTVKSRSHRAHSRLASMLAHLIEPSGTGS